MSKTSDVVLAGIIAGIVAYSTSVLGISGAIIGSVVGAILYQLIPHLFKKPLEGIKTQDFSGGGENGVSAWSEKLTLSMG